MNEWVNEWINEMWAKSIKLNILTLMEIHTCDDGKFNNILFVYEMLLFYTFPFGRCLCKRSFQEDEMKLYLFVTKEGGLKGNYF